MAFKRFFSGLILLFFVVGVVFAASDLDSDEDGFTDSVDNCPYDYNKDQADFDSDSLGDVCDKCSSEYGLDGFGCPIEVLDSDADGFEDSVDNCPYKYNKDQADSDGDGLGDVCDSCDDRDEDNDGVVNCEDDCPEEFGSGSNYGCPEVVKTTTTRVATTTRVSTTVVSECVLSLCDCKCYPKGSSPEEVSKLLCGINCLKEYGVSSCDVKQGKCIEKRVQTATTTTIPVKTFINITRVLNAGLGGRVTVRANDPSGILLIGVLVDGTPRGKCYGRTICSLDVSDLTHVSNLSAYALPGNRVPISIGRIDNLSQYIAKIPCSISGVLHEFPFAPSTVAVEFCEAYRLSGIGSIPGLAQCRNGGRIWKVNVSQLEFSEGLEYGEEVSCNGSYLVRPVYQPADRECAWRGTWTANSREFINVNNSIHNNVDFTFNAEESTPMPLIDVASQALSPATFGGQGNFNLSFYFNNGGVNVQPEKMWIDGEYLHERFTSDFNGPLQIPLSSNLPVPVHLSCSPASCPAGSPQAACTPSPCTIRIPYDQYGKSVKFNLSIIACDPNGVKVVDTYTRRLPAGNAGDLSINSIEAVQVVYGAYLVKGKATAFRINLSSSFPYDVEAKVRLILPSGRWGFVSNSANQNIIFPTGWRFPELWGPIRIPANSRNFEFMAPIIPNWQKNETIMGTNLAGRIIPGLILAGVYGPDVRIMPTPVETVVQMSVEVDPENTVPESIEENNRRDSANYSVVTTKRMRFAFFRVLGGVDGDDCPYNISAGPTFDSVRRAAKANIEYFLGTYPIADGKISYAIMPTTDLAFPLNEERSDYLRRQYRLIRSTDYDWAVGVTCGCCGATCGWDVKSILIGNDSNNWHNVAHEAGHITNFGATNDCYGCMDRGNDVDCSSCVSSEGFWVNKMQKYPLENPPPWWNPARNGNWNNTANSAWLKNCYYMDFSNYAPYCWQRTAPLTTDNRGTYGDGYNNIMYRLSNPRDPDGIIVSGRISKDGSVTFDPFVIIRNTTLDIEPNSGEGDYSIAVYGKDARLLRTQKFNAYFWKSADPPQSGWVETNQTGFAYVVEWTEDVASIELQGKEGAIIAKRPVSQNTPTVNVVYPNGGEKILKNAPLKIKWTASDLDNDEMTYVVAISSDDGAIWIPIAIDVSAEEYTLNPIELSEGSQYLVRITATDGVNTGKDVSDAAFTLASGEPSTGGTESAQGCPLFSIIGVIGAAAGGLVKLIR